MATGVKGIYKLVVRRQLTNKKLSCRESESACVRNIFVSLSSAAGLLNKLSVIVNKDGFGIRINQLIENHLDSNRIHLFKIAKQRAKLPE